MNGKTPSPQAAILLITRHCPHCATMLEHATQLTKEACISPLQIVNLEADPSYAETYQVRTVPWIKIGPLQFDGLQSLATLRNWAHKAGTATGLQDYIEATLNEGNWQKIDQLTKARSDYFAIMLQLFGNPDNGIQVQLGLTTIFEQPHNQPILAQSIPTLQALTTHASPQLRADACYLLGLSQSPTAIDALRLCLNDPDPSVREIATEEMEKLTSIATDQAPPDADQPS